MADLKIGHYTGGGGAPRKAGPTKARKRWQESQRYEEKNPGATAACGAPGVGSEERLSPQGLKPDFWRGQNVGAEAPTP